MYELVWTDPSKPTPVPPITRRPRPPPPPPSKPVVAPAIDVPEPRPSLQILTSDHTEGIKGIRKVKPTVYKATRHINCKLNA